MIDQIDREYVARGNFLSLLRVLQFQESCFILYRLQLRHSAGILSASIGDVRNAKDAAATMETRSFVLEKRSRVTYRYSRIETFYVWMREKRTRKRGKRKESNVNRKRISSISLQHLSPYNLCNSQIKRGRSVEDCQMQLAGGSRRGPNALNHV